MNRFIAVALAALVLAPNLAVAKKYIYVSYAVNDDYHDGKDTFTLDPDIGFLYADHGSQKIKVCDKSDDFFCLYGTSINFAVPRKSAISIGASWEKNGRGFHVERAEAVEMLGKKVDVFIISSQVSEDRTDYFYYSVSRGLLGIKFAYRKQFPTRFLWLTQKNGFPR